MSLHGDPPGRPEDRARNPEGPRRRRIRGDEVIRPGDRVFFEPGEDHWHGAGATRFMAHVAIQQADEEGSVVTWGEHVTDDEYNATDRV